MRVRFHGCISYPCQTRHLNLAAPFPPSIDTTRQEESPPADASQLAKCSRSPMQRCIGCTRHQSDGKALQLRMHSSQFRASTNREHRHYVRVERCQTLKDSPSWYIADSRCAWFSLLPSNDDRSTHNTCRYASIQEP
jgi:hypothetical protein